METISTFGISRAIAIAIEDFPDAVVPTIERIGESETEFTRQPQVFESSSLVSQLPLPNSLEGSGETH